MAQTDEIVRSDAAAAQATRATTRGFYHFKALAPSVCQVTYLLQVKLGGSIPKAIMASRTKRVLGAVQEMQDKFERKGAVVDAEMRSAFPPPPPLAELNIEQKLVVESCRYLESEEGGEWEPLPSSSPFIDMWRKHTPAKKGERSVAIGKGTAVIDCPARDAAQFMFSYTSRERMRIDSEEGNPARLRQRANSAHDQVFATVKKMPFPLNNREFVARQLCTGDANGDLLVTIVPLDEVIDYGLKHRTVRGVSRALMRFTPFGESQCQVTYIQYLDANGRIPTFVVESKIPEALGAVGELRDEFQRDDEIDKLERDQLAKVIKEEPQTYTAEEDILINKVHAKLGMLEWGHFEELESPDHLVNMCKISIEGGGVGRASVAVDASIEECAAWEIAKMNREQAKDAGSLERSFTKTNDHHGVYHVVYDFKIPGFQQREFLSSLVWGQQGDKLVVLYDDVEHVDFPVSPSLVRATTTIYCEYVGEQSECISLTSSSTCTHSRLVHLP